ncbi:MFS transporter [Yersinia ruckeri]|uniref:peptide MFS transporter n=1 Tax=Yersinia ruckeri TaxID=29486 RepID=UPI0004E38DEA|nr:oligopeptide:H+ symporter [Yersinia ruckeri]ARZ01209.1 inner membrane transporter YhiP [Yersinia ruckeri]KFE39456.1 MFS transporter [Yersinia ruckeri]OIX36930.1 MFS transporter [Yersinia ruckeri]OIX37301.1 MFS transporter [Yersinia ruckeri]OIX37753.1 MFS transporter [Yersinia ruckeri]
MPQSDSTQYQNHNHLQAIPSGAGTLFFVQTFATLGFAVLYSTLVLYTTKRLGFSESHANAIMGVFGAFNYGLHLFGGYLGGRYLSNRNLFVLGMALQVIGCWLIAVYGLSGLYWGLAMFLTGSGLNVTCLNMMLTQRFLPDDDRRESAFLWNYAGMNLGFFLGFAVAGYFQLSENYRALFLFATVGNVAAIAITCCRWRVLADINTPLLQASVRQAKGRMLMGILVLIVMVPIIRLLLTHAGFSSYFVLAVGIAVFVLLGIVTTRHYPHVERRRMLAYLLLAAGSLVFWALYQLAPMGLMLFAEHNIDLNVYGWPVAPQWIQNINTLVIVVGGPLMALWFRRLRQRGFSIDIPLQFSGALLCMGFGMLVLPLGIHLAGGDGLVAFKWIALSYLLQSLGELLISPIGYAMIGKLAPPRYQGVMMGCWMMVTGVASVLAGYVSGLMPANSGSTPLETNPGYSDIFSLLGWGALLTGAILIILIPLLRRLIQENALAGQSKLVAQNR